MNDKIKSATIKMIVAMVAVIAIGFWLSSLSGFGLIPFVLFLVIFFPSALYIGHQSEIIMQSKEEIENE